MKQNTRVVDKVAFWISGLHSFEAAFLLVDELLELFEVSGARLGRDVMSGDIDDGEGFVDLAHVVSKPSEGRDEVFDFWAEEDGEGFVEVGTTSDEHAFVAIDEGFLEESDCLIGEGTESHGASASLFAHVGFEGEGARGGFEEAADLFVVKAEDLSGFGVGAVLSVSLDDFTEVRFWEFGDECSGIGSHGRGL